MIENELRATFQRAEDLVGDATRLLPGIDIAAKRRRSRRRVVQSCAAALAVLVAVAVPTWARGQFAERPAPPPVGQGNGNGAVNILIAGLDSGGPAPRSEALIIAHVPADRRSVFLVTVPSDLAVNIPEHGPRTLSEAFSLGRSPLMTLAMSDLSGLRFDGEVIVDFAGLVSVVDSLGGVRMCVDRRTSSPHTHKVYEPGCRTFDGADTTDYLRQRGYPLTAEDRDRHVVQFLAALAQQVKAAGTSTDFLKLGALVELFGPAVRVESTLGSVLTLAWDLRGCIDRIVAVRLPVTEGPPATHLTPAASELFAALRADTVDAWVAAHPEAVQSLG